MTTTILNISQNYYVRGGSDRYFFGLGELLERHGQRVIPFSSRQARNLPSAWESYFPRGVDFEKPGLSDLARYVYSRSAAQSLARLLDDEQIDLAHLHIYYGQLTGSILPVLREAGIPIVQTVHDFKVVCPVYSLMSGGSICEACRGREFWRATINRCNRGSLARSALSTVESYVSRWLGNVDYVDRFISVSNFQRQKLIELGIPGERIATVYNYADTGGVAAEQTPGDYLLYFGRIERLKGVLTLVEAARQAPQVKLVVAGRGEASDELAAAIRAQRLTNVEIVGFKQGPELERLVRGSIATILPSEGYDNCPMAILESYTYGKPVIGSRIGGIPELIRDGIDGLVFGPGDAETLAAHLTWMDQHRELAVEMGLAGRRKVEEEFNSETHYQRIREVYSTVGIELAYPNATPDAGTPTVDLLPFPTPQPVVCSLT